jgi:hypothetical protein
MKRRASEGAATGAPKKPQRVQGEGLQQQLTKLANELSTLRGDYSSVHKKVAKCLGTRPQDSKLSSLFVGLARSVLEAPHPPISKFLECMESLHVYPQKEGDEQPRWDDTPMQLMNELLEFEEANRLHRSDAAFVAACLVDTTPAENADGYINFDWVDTNGLLDCIREELNRPIIRGGKDAKQVLADAFLKIKLYTFRSVPDGQK